MMKNRSSGSFSRILSLIAIACATLLIAVLFSNLESGDPPPVTDSEVSAPISSDLVLTDPVSDLPTEQTSSSETETVTETDTADTTETEVNITTQIPPPQGTTKKIAFTFDDGPHYKFTKQIADSFEKNGGNCTFFVVANRIRGSNAEAMIYAAAKGNEIGSHSYTHTKYFNKCSDAEFLDEMQKADQAIKSAINVSPTLLRPPGGNMTKERIAAAPYAIILWNVDPRDWDHKTENKQNVDIIVNNVLSAVTDGDIILMHDIYQNTADAIEILLPKLKEQGYEFVTVSELLGEHLAPGIRYYSAY